MLEEEEGGEAGLRSTVPDREEDILGVDTLEEDIPVADILEEDIPEEGNLEEDSLEVVKNILVEDILVVDKRLCWNVLLVDSLGAVGAMKNIPAVDIPLVDKRRPSSDILLVAVDNLFHYLPKKIIHIKNS